MNELLDKVIVALDYEDPDKAYRLVDEIGDLVTWFKVGPVLFTRSGNEIIRFLHKKGKRIFLDLKLYDTPVVVGDTVRQFADMGVQFATVHCTGGRSMLEAASASCRGSQLKLLGVTLLTSHHAADTRITHHGDSGLVLKMVELALEARLAGILCSPHEIEEVLGKTLPGFLLVTPGIRLPGQEVFRDDQKRVASPREALDWGADFLIIGRPITQAREPRDTVLKLFESGSGA